VILMDINLPDISGIDALRLLRKDPATEHIPLVAISANAMPHDIERGLQAGFFRYLTKPIKVDEFMAALNAALELQRTRSKLSQEALTVLPGALVELLREATLAANPDRIMELIQRVEAYDRDIASELRVLASRFAYQRLLNLLTPGKDAS
jgi:DNA-binding response OmpR family regulator